MTRASTSQLRRTLCMTTALASGALVATGPAWAQMLPGGGTVAGGGATIGTPTPNGTNGGMALGIQTDTNRSIINWQTFNIGAEDRVDFTNGMTSAADRVAILNRVVGSAGNNPSTSTISGMLNSSSNISVYLINPTGIVFGSGANVNVGGLIASTLDLADADFLDGNDSFNFTGIGTGGVGMSGGTINGGEIVAFMGHFVNVSGGSITSADDVAFVAGSDVTLAVTPGSPLSLTISQGTAVANPLVVGGTVNGQNVYVGMASQSSVADSVLSVTGMVTATTAMETDRGIVLAAGTSAGGITVSGAGNTAGNSKVSVTGSLTADDGGNAANQADVEVRAIGAVSGSGAVNADDRVTLESRDDNVIYTGAVTTNLLRGSAGGSFALTAAANDLQALGPITAGNGVAVQDSGALTISDDVSGGTGAVAIGAAGALTVTGGASTLISGSSVALTGTTIDAAATVSAGGDITLDATDGADPRVTLRSATLTSTSGDVEIAGNLAVAGTAGISGATTTFGGTIDSETSPATLTVTATGAGNSFNGAVGGTNLLASLIVTGPSVLANTANSIRAVDQLTLGAVTLDPSLTGLVTLATTGATGTLSVGGIADADTTANDLTLTAAGGIRATDIGSVTNKLGNITFNGDTRLATTIVSSGAVVFNDDLLLAAGTHSITGASTEFVGTINGETAGTADLTVTATDTTNTFRDDIGNSAPLFALTVNGSTLLNAGTVTTTGSQTYNGALSLGADTVLSSTGTGAAGTFAALDGNGSSLTLSFAGPIDINGSFSELDEFTATGSSIDFSGQSIATSSNASLRSTNGAITGGDISSGSDIALNAAGNVAVGALSAVDDIAIRATGSASTGALTSGAPPATDTAGAADTLAGTTLTGNDIDIVANGVTVNGAARANGASSDLRIDGGATGIGNGAQDLDLAAGGNLALASAARGRDVALSAGGTLNAQAISARDDIAVRATGAATLGALTSGTTVDSLAPTDVSGAADSLLSASDLTGNDIDAAANGLVLTGAARALGTGSDIRLAGGAGGIGDGAQDLDLAAGGNIALADAARGRDVALSAGGNINAGSISARDDIAIRAVGTATLGALTSGTSVDSLAATDAEGAADILVTDNAMDGNDIDVAGSTIAVGIARANGSGSDIRLRGPVAQGAADLDLDAGGDIALGGLATARDVALNAGGLVNTQEIRASDDIAIRAVGTVTTGALTSGFGTAVDEEGAADTLVTTDALDGNDIDIAGNGVTLTGPATANGAGSDIRIAGGATGTGNAGQDLDLNAGGAILITGAARGLDIALNASGPVQTGTLNAADDIAIRAGGLVTTGDLTSGSSGGSASSAGAADTLTGATLAGNSIDIGGSSISVGLARAFGADSTIRLRGPVTASRDGEGDSCGPDLCLDSDGDVIIDGAADGRDIAIRAGRDVTTAALTAGDDIVIRAGRAVSTGDLTSGPDATAQEGAGDPLVGDNNLDGNDVDVAGSTITVGIVRANGTGSDIRLRGPVTQGAGTDLDLASGGDIVLGGAASARDVALNAGGLVSTQAIQATDDIAIRAVGSVTTGALSVGGSGVDAEGAADALVTTNPLDGNDIDIAGNGVTFNGPVRANSGAGSDARIDGGATGTGTAGQDLDIRVGGDLSIVGTARGLDIALNAGNLVDVDALVAGDDIAIRAGGLVTTGDLTTGAGASSLGAADDLVNTLDPGATLPGNSIDIRGTSISVGRARAIGPGSFIRLRGPVTGDRGDASDTCGLDLCLDADGDVIVEGAADGRDVAIRAGGAISAGAISADDDLVLRAGGDIGTGALTSGAAEADGEGDALAGRATFDLTSGGSLLAVSGADIAIGGASTADVDIALSAAGAVSAAALTAGDDLVIRAGGAVTTGNLTSGPDAATQEGAGDPLVSDNNLDGNDIDVAGSTIAVGIARANGTGSDIRLRGPVAQGAADLDLGAGGDIVLGGLATARDVALNAGGLVNTQEIRASDDIAIRAVGTVTTGALTSGFGTAVDEEGAADTLVTTDTLDGNDIDIAGNGVTLTGPATANGAGSDIRIAGGTTGTGNAGQDLDLNAGGAILITGAARGLDIALNASGPVQTGTLNAADDIAIRAGGLVTTGDLTSGSSGGASSSAGAADTLAGATLAGNSIDIGGSSISVGLARAFGADSTIRLRGPVTASRDGEGDSCGPDLCLDSDGDVIIDGAADGRDTAIRAGRDVTTAALTAGDDIVLGAGRSISTGALTAAAAEAVGAGDSGAGGTFDLTGGGNILAAAGAGSISVTGAISSDVDVALSAATSVTTLGQTAGDDIVIRAGGVVTTGNLTTGPDGAAQEGAGDPLVGDNDLAGNDIDVAGSTITVGIARANGTGSDIRLRGPVSQGAADLDLGAGGDIVLGGTASARDVALNAGGLVNTQEIRASDDIAIRAVGTVTTGALTSGFGTSVDTEGAADTLVGGADPLDGQDIDIAGSAIAVGVTRANGTGSDVRLRGPASGSGPDLDLGAGGDILLTDLATGRDIALDAGGSVSTQELRANDDLAIRAVGTVATGAITSGFAPAEEAEGAADALVTDDPLDGQDVDIAGSAITIGTARANGTGSDIRLRGPVTGANPDLDLVAGGNIVLTGLAAARDIALAAGGQVSTQELRANDDIAIRAVGAVTTGTLTSGFAPATDAEGAADALVTDDPLDGNDIDIAGATIAIPTATANGALGDLRLRANAGDLTITTGTAGGNATLNAAGTASGTSLTAQNGDVLVAAGPLANFDTLSASEDVRVFAGSVLVGSATADTGLLVLSAASGQLTLGTGSAGTTASLFKMGGTGELQVTSLTAGTQPASLGNIVIQSTTNARIGDATSQTGSISVNVPQGEVTGIGAGRVNLTAAASGRDISVFAGTLARLGTLTAGRHVLVRAGNRATPISGSVDLLDATGVDIAIEAIGGSLTARDLTARDDIALRADGAVSTRDLTSGAAPAIDQEGSADALVTDNSMDGNDVDVAGASIAVGTVRANGPGSDVRLRGPVTGTGPDLDIRAGGDIVLAGLAQARDVALGAGGLVDTQGIRANDDIAIRAGTTVTTGDLASGVAPAVDTDATGAADDLLADRGETFDLTGNDIDIRGTGISSSRADTNPDPNALGRRSDLRLVATADQLTLGAGTVGGAATLTKQGAVGELQVTGTLAAGQAGTPDAAQPAGDVAITSDRNARLGTISSGTGSISVAAITGEVTGVGAGGRANLLAPGVVESGGAVSTGRDVSVDAGTLARLGTVQAGRDIALNVRAGALDASTATARDDIAFRAAGAATLGTLTTGDASGLDQAGAADALAGTSLTGSELDGQALSVAVTEANVGLSAPAAIGVQSDLRLQATNGALVLGTGRVGGRALLDKRGATGAAGDELRAGALQTGRATGADGDAFLVSATDMRAGTIEAAGGSIDIRAGEQVTSVTVGGDGAIAVASTPARDGAVTGLAGSSTGLDPTFGRAILRATPPTGGASGAGSTESVTVTAGGLVQLGEVAADEDVTITAGTSTVADRDGAIDISSVTATRGALSLSAFNNDPASVAGIRLGASNADPAAATTDAAAADSRVATSVTITTTSDAAEPARLRSDIVVARSLTAGTLAGSEGTITIDSVADAHLASGSFRVESLTGSIAVTSRNGDVTGIQPASNAERGGSSSVALTSVSSGGDLTVNGSGDVRIGAATSRGGDVDVDAGGSVTGLALAGSTAPEGANLVASRPPSGDNGRDVTVTAQRLARLGTVSATRDITITAGAVSVASADAGRNLSVQSTGTGGAGAPVQATRLWSGNDILAPDYGQAQLTAEAAGATIEVDAGQIAQLGQVRAGTGTSQSAGNQIDVDARALTISQTLAANGALALNARDGGLYLGTNLGVNEGAGQAGTAAGASGAGTGIAIAKAGATETQDADRADLNNEVRLRTTLTANTAAGADGDVAILSARSVRLNQVTAARNGSIEITAGADRVGGDNIVRRRGDVSGLAGAGAGNSDAVYLRGNLAAGDDVTVRAGALVQLGTVAAGRNISVQAGLPTSVNGAVDITTATASTGSLSLLAFARSTADPARDGDIILESGSAATAASLNNVQTGGTTGDIVVGSLASGQSADTSIPASNRTVVVASANNVRAVTVSADGGAVDIRAGVDASRNVVRDGAVTGRAGASNGLAPSFGRGTVTASASGVDGVQSVTIRAGGLVQLGAVTADDSIGVTAGLESVAAADGAIDISSARSANGFLTLSAFNDSTDPARPADVRLGTSNAGGIAATDTGALDSSARADATIDTRGTRGNVIVGRTLTAGRDATLASVADVLLAQAPFELRAGRDIRVTAARNLDGLPAGGNDTGEALVPGSGLRAGTVSARGDVTIDGAGNVRLRDATSTQEDITITAGGSLTGLSQDDSGDAISGAGRLFAGRDVTVRAGPLARVTEIAAGTSDTGASASATGGDVALFADTVAIGAATARAGSERAGDVGLTARGSGLHLGTGTADGALTLRALTTGSLSSPAAGDLANPDAASRDVLDTRHGFANLAAQAANRTVTVTAGTNTPGADPFGAAQLGTVSAGTGTGPATGDQVTVTADRLTITELTAANGAVALSAREGPLYLGAGSVGTSARLDKQGAANSAGNELRVRQSLTTGTATGTTGDAVVISATDARLGTLEARGGSIDIRAGADSSGAAMRDGDVTGLAVSSPISSVGLDAGHGRARLAATGSVAVRAGGLVQAGSVTAGQDILVEAGSETIPERDGAIDISSAVASNGSLALTAFNDDAGALADIRLGSVAGADGAATDEAASDSDAGTTATLTTRGGRGDVVVGRSLRAGGTVSIDSTRDVRFAPAPFEIRSRGGDILVTAVRDVTGLVAGGTGTGAALVGGGELRVGSATSSGDLLIDSRGNVRLGSATSGGNATVNADGSVTGLPAAPSSVTGAGRLFAARDVTVTAGPTARISEIGAGTTDTGATASASGGDVSVTADIVAVERARARSGAERAGNVQLTSRRSGMHLGSGQADGTLTLATGAPGALATPPAGNLGSPDDPTRDVLDIDHGAADITAAAAVSVTAGRAGPATAPFGAAQLDDVVAGTDATVVADRLTVARATAGGALAVTSREGPLFLGTGTAGTSATLVKEGGAAALGGDELRVRDSLTAGTDATIRTATDARLGSVTAQNGTIDIRAGADAAGTPVRYGEVTGLAVSSPAAPVGLSATHDRATLTSGASTNVEAGGLVQLGAVQAGQDIRVDAGTESIGDRDGAIDITSAAAANGSLRLRAFNDDAGRLAGVRLGTRDASGTAEVDPAAADSSAGTTAELRTLGTRGDVVIGQSLTARGATGSGSITLGSVVDVRLASAPDSAADAAPEGVRSLSDDVVITAARNVTGLVAGGDDTGEALVAGSGLRAGTVTGTGDITIEGAGNVRLRSVTSRAEDIVVTAGGSVTGLAGSDSGDPISGAGRVFAGRNVSVTAGDTARLTRVASAGSATVGATSVAVGATTAGTNVSMTASGTGLHVGTSDAGGNTSLRVQTAGALATPPVGDLAGPGAATRDTLATTHGAANLAAQAANKTVAVTAGTQTPGTAPLGAAQLGTVTAGAGSGAAAGVNQIAVTADRLTVSSATASNGALVITAREGPLFLGNGSAGTSATLTKQGAVNNTGAATGNELRVRGTLTAGTASGSTGNVTVATATDARLNDVVGRNGTVDVTAANNVTGIALTAPASNRGGDLGFGGANLRTGDGTAGIDVNVTAGELAQLGTVAAGRAINISSNAIELIGGLTAPEVNITNRPQRSNPTRLGGNETLASGNFVLSEAELNRISADRVTIESGSQNVEVQGLALGTNVGRARLGFLTIGRVDVTGTLGAAGSPDTRTIQIGGSRATANGSDPSTLASVIAVGAGSTGGGRLLAGDANLDLRGGVIVVGEPELLNAVGAAPGATPIAFDRVANEFISNPNSLLYNPTGTGLSDPIILTANTLSVTYGNFALFQNTSPAFLPPSGVNIGDLQVNATLALRSTGDNAPNGFALFGVINGRSGNQAALLGPQVVPLEGVNRSNTRINGCLVGSGGGGCLVSSVGTPTISVFDERQANILQAAGDLDNRFDPIVGTNNEALFTGISSIDEIVEPEVDCEADPNAPECTAPPSEDSSQ